MNFGTTGNNMGNNSNPNKNYLVPGCPNDSISELAWCPTQNFLAAASWNCEVKVWQIQTQGQQFNAVGKLMYKHQAPVLCCDISPDGKVLSGGCDNIAKVHALPGVNLGVGNNSVMDFGKHDAPIKIIHAVPAMNAYLTGGWDRFIKFWDARLSNTVPVLSNQLPEKIYASDVKKNLLTIACAGKKIITYDLRQPSKPMAFEESTLRCQTRCVSLMNDLSGYTVGSIEGRVSVHYFKEDPSLKRKNFAFKCHRESKDIYAINSLSFNPKFGTFSTAGADGRFHFWDKDAKQRIHQFQKCDAQIVSGKFNMDGTIYAYALSYDFSKGPNPNHFNRNYGSKIYLNYCQEHQIKNRQRR